MAGPSSPIGPEIRRFLMAHRVGHLGTADDQGQPHVVPICYAVGETRIYSVIDDKPKSVAKSRLKRIKNILSNPNVCLTIDTYFDDWSKLAFVIVQGRASIIETGSEHGMAAELLRARYTQYRDMDMEARPIVVIEPTRIVKWRAV